MNISLIFSKVLKVKCVNSVPPKPKNYNNNWSNVSQTTCLPLVGQTNSQMLIVHLLLIVYIWSILSMHGTLKIKQMTMLPSCSTSYRKKLLLKQNDSMSVCVRQRHSHTEYTPWSCCLVGGDRPVTRNATVLNAD